MKKIIHKLVLCVTSLLMMFTICTPLFAEGEDTTTTKLTINSIEVNAGDTAPLVGDTGEISGYSLNINGSVLSTASEYYDDISVTAHWIEEGTSDPFTAASTIEEGKKYQKYVCVTFKDFNNLFVDNFNGKVSFDGIEYDFEGTAMGTPEGMNLYLSNENSLPAGVSSKTTKEITSIEIKNEDVVPVAGNSLEKESVGLLYINGEQVSEEDKNQFTIQMEWENVDYSNTSKTLEAGKKYRLWVLIKVSDSESVHYVDKTQSSFTVNGSVKYSGGGSGADDSFIVAGYVLSQDGVEATASEKTLGFGNDSSVSVETGNTSTATVNAVIKKALSDNNFSEDKLSSASLAIFVENATPATEEETKIKEALPSGYEVSNYLNIQLNLVIDAVGYEVKEAGSAVTVTLTIPESIQKEGRVYKVIRMHDGKAEVIGTYTPGSDYKISVESDKFSTYAIAYHDHTWSSAKVIKAASQSEEGLQRYTCTTCGETKDEVIAKSKTPATADSMDLLPVASMIIAIAAVVYFVSIRKKFN